MMNTQHNIHGPMALGHRPLAATSARPGFSLIEILMVIAIISVLTAMAVFATTALLKQGQVSQTKALLQQLQTIEAEYRLQAGSSWDHNVTPANAPAFVDTSIERFVYVAMQIPEARSMMTTVDKRLLKDLDGDSVGDTVEDPFGTAIAYRQSVTTTSDPDGLPQYPRPFFASAGQDEEFGTDDDLFSFDQE